MIFGQIGSGNGMLQEGTKSLPKPMLMNLLHIVSHGHTLLGLLPHHQGDRELTYCVAYPLPRFV